MKWCRLIFRGFSISITEKKNDILGAFYTTITAPFFNSIAHDHKYLRSFKLSVEAFMRLFNCCFRQANLGLSSSCKAYLYYSIEQVTKQFWTSLSHPCVRHLLYIISVNSHNSRRWLLSPFFIFFYFYFFFKSHGFIHSLNRILTEHLCARHR